MKSGAEVCVTVTLLDGLVLARSPFHHSMNYRSVVVIGHPQVHTLLSFLVFAHACPAHDSMLYLQHSLELPPAHLQRFLLPAVCSCAA